MPTKQTFIELLGKHGAKIKDNEELSMQVYFPSEGVESIALLIMSAGNIEHMLVFEKDKDMREYKQGQKGKTAEAAKKPNGKAK